MSEENSSNSQDLPVLSGRETVGVPMMCCLHPEKSGVCGAPLNVFGTKRDEVQCMYGHRFDLATVRNWFFRGCEQ